MSITTSHELMKNKLNEIQEKEGSKIIQRLVIVFELPFVVDEDDLVKFFSKKAGAVKKIEILRAGALVFSSAIIEFQKKNSVNKALDCISQTHETLGGDFDVIAQSAEDFLAGKKPPRKPKPGDKKLPSTTSNNEKCTIQ